MRASPAAPAASRKVPAATVTVRPPSRSPAVSNLATHPTKATATVVPAITRPSTKSDHLKVGRANALPITSFTADLITRSARLPRTSKDNEGQRAATPGSDLNNMTIARRGHCHMSTLVPDRSQVAGGACRSARLPTSRVQFGQDRLPTRPPLLVQPSETKRSNGT